MPTVLTLLTRTLLAFVDTLATLAGALGVRWLFGYSTPEKDWRLLQEWWGSLRALLIIPDPLAGVNLAYLTAMRARFLDDCYREDTISHVEHEERAMEREREGEIQPDGAGESATERRE
jgi:hypothetical protein